MRVALAAFGVWQCDGVADFASRVTSLAEEAKRGGADMLVLAEYAAMVVAGGTVCAPDIAAELDAVVNQADEIVDTLREAARATKIWLVGGTVPMRDADGAVRNRAPVIDDAGRLAFQDKRVMTRFEAERWGVCPGEPPAVFDTPWGRIGVAICYDSEFPPLVRSQVEAGAFAILVPTCTDTVAGFNRVRLSARARAIENQCFVGVAPLVGTAPWSGAIDENRGYACAFAPVDRGFPEDGVLARGALDQPGLVFADFDPARIAAVRADGAVLNHRDFPAPPPVAAKSALR
jgi:predicted amidohydrolase